MNGHSSNILRLKFIPSSTFVFDIVKTTMACVCSFNNCPVSVIKQLTYSRERIYAFLFSSVKLRLHGLYAEYSHKGSEGYFSSHCSRINANVNP